jgi:LuxR family maltose regulon positive regulatory protein
MNESANIEFSRILVQQGRLEEGGRLLTRLKPAAESAGRAGRLMQIQVLQAQVLQAAGDQASAVAALLQAVSLAEPEGVISVFIDEGDRLIPLLKAVWNETKENKLAVFLERLLQTLGVVTPIREANGAQPLVSAPPLSAQMIDDLSRRELEILRLIAGGLSNQEIALKLFLAESTIHWHVKNIYGKLGVHSRTQAIFSARQLGFLA